MDKMPILYSDSITAPIDNRTLELALELTKFQPFPDNVLTDVDAANELAVSLNSLSLLHEDIRSKKSANMTECVPVPSSEHVAEIVGRQGCKIKALRAKTNTYIKTPVRGEEPVFVVTGRKEDVNLAKKEIISAANHFSQIRASRKNNLTNITPGLAGQAGRFEDNPDHVTDKVIVPYRVVGLVVGPKGATIKRIQHQTRTYIVTPSRDKDPVFEVTGLPENVKAAREEIQYHIISRTGANATALSGLQNFSNIDEHDLLLSLCKGGLSSLLAITDGSSAEQFPIMTSSTTSSGIFSSSSSNSSITSKDSPSTITALWSNNDKDEGLGESPNNDNLALWTYPASGAFGQATRRSPSLSPTETLLASNNRDPTKCYVCQEAKITHAVIPCGHNYFCMNCANKFVGENEALSKPCPICNRIVDNSLRIISNNS